MLLGVLGVQIYAAGSTRAVVGSPVRWKYENYGSGMNVYGNETVSNGSRVTLWEHSNGSNAQLWVLQQDLWGNYRIYSNLAYSVGSGYTINRHSVNSSCIMWSDSSSSSSTDAAVEIYTIDSVYRRIALVYGTNNYLTCEGNPGVNGVNLVWSTYANAGLFRETSP